MRYRFQWTAAAATSPHDPNVVYHGAQVVFRSTDGGQSWAAISPDLTRNDSTKQRWTGGPITGDGTGVETYGTVFAIAESPRQAGLIWAGSDDGLVHLSRDAGRTWANVTSAMPGFPEWGTVSLIEPSPHDAGTAYVVVDRHRLDDMRPYLYKTTDYGRSWRRLDAGLAQDVYLHAVREDPARRGLLFLGTERGVMVSQDDGATWQSLKLNLPTVAVHDLVIKDNDLVVGTHGRSIWILDDLTPIRRHSPAVTAKAAHLFPPQPSVQWQARSGYGRRPAGDNPPRGVAFTYWLQGKPAGPVTVEVLDQRGTVIRKLSSEPRPRLGVDDGEQWRDPPRGELPADRGLQRAVWDFRYEGAELIPRGKIDTGDPSEGPEAAPGRYLLRLSADGSTDTASVEVRPDPRDRTSQADREAQLAFGLEVRDQITRVTRLVARLRAMQRQLEARNEVLRAKPDAAALVQASDSVIRSAVKLEDQLHNSTAEVTYDILAMRGGARLYSRLAPLLMWAIEGTGAPTQGMREVFAMERRELDELSARVDTLITGDLARLEAAAARLGVGTVVIP
jgi:hypothetical protein